MKKSLPAIAALFLILFNGCSGNNSTADKSLSASDQKNDYKVLFDGKTMEGWRTFKNASAADWSADSGVLHCKGKGGEISADLVTQNEYENFDLSLDWKISPKGNSGILYMVSEDSSASYVTGPEYQIIDDVNFPEHLEDWQKTAADYAMYPAPTARPNPVGEWNNTRILVNGNQIEHWLNGQKVVSYELYSPDWEKKKKEGKWKDHPSYGMFKKGHITFQDHGSEAWFKNIKIKEL